MSAVAAGLWLAATLLPFSTVLASGLQVTPVSLSLPANQAASGLWLRNTGDASLHAQVRVYRWSQEGGTDRLEPSRALVVSPPMMQLAAGASQLVRVIRTGAPPATVEAAYRLVVNELPKTASEGGLNFVLRYSIPVFVQPTGGNELQPDLHWSLVRDGGHMSLAVRNRGSGHAQISAVHMLDAAGHRQVLKKGLLGYVLPGQEMRWQLGTAAAALNSGAALQARVNGETVTPALVPGAGSR